MGFEQCLAHSIINSSRLLFSTRTWPEDERAIQSKIQWKAIRGKNKSKNKIEFY